MKSVNVISYVKIKGLKVLDVFVNYKILKFWWLFIY